jgi:hypothetical protein
VYTTISAGRLPYCSWQCSMCRPRPPPGASGSIQLLQQQRSCPGEAPYSTTSADAGKAAAAVAAVTASKIKTTNDAAAQAASEAVTLLKTTTKQCWVGMALCISTAALIFGARRERTSASVSFRIGSCWRHRQKSPEHRSAFALECSRTISGLHSCTVQSDRLGTSQQHDLSRAKPCAIVASCLRAQLPQRRHQPDPGD